MLGKLCRNTADDIPDADVFSFGIIAVKATGPFMSTRVTVLCRLECIQLRISWHCSPLFSLYPASVDLATSDRRQSRCLGNQVARY